ncbi:MAG: glycosyltransferase family 2 protein [Gammaproteobacteria bacterium]|nr:glycosyltransferase family 2 protein [Gammaproteobacteria bacterium]
MADPIVSVIMPCYNQGAFVDAAVDSVLEQTLAEVEILIVNDGSTDADTNAKLERFDRPRTRVIQQSNAGPARARNAAIRQARGRYILPLDADDLILPDYLRKASEVLDRDQSIGMVYGEAEFFGERSEHWNLPTYSFPGVLIENSIFNSMVYRRADWERTGGYNPNMEPSWEDYDFVLSLVELGVGVYKLDDLVYRYRVRSVSRDHTLGREAHLDLYERLFRNHPQLYAENIRFLFAQIYDLRHQVSQQKHHEHDRLALGHRVRHLERLLEGRERQLVDCRAQREALRVQAGRPWRALGVRRKPARPAVTQHAEYSSWLEAHERQAATATATELTGSGQIVIAVLYPTGEAEALRATLDSLVAQSQPRWRAWLYGEARGAELPAGCEWRGTEADWPSVASSAALDSAAADGPAWLVRLRAGERLAPQAVARLLEAAGGDSRTVMYADQDSATAGPMLRPGPSPERLAEFDYIGRACAVPLGESDGADRPLHQRLLSAAADRKLRCIRDVLFHDVTEPQPVPGARLRYPVPGRPPLEVILGEADPEALAQLVVAAEGLAITLRVPPPLAGIDVPFPVRALESTGLPACDELEGEHILFLDPAVRMRGSGWIAEFLEHSHRSQTGCIGPVLLDGDGLVSEAGLIFADGEFWPFAAGCAADTVPFEALSTVRDTSAVGGRCLMVKRFLLDQFGGVARHLAPALQLPELALRIRESGYRNLCLGQVRGVAPPPAHDVRESDRDYLLARHHRLVVDGDPFSHPWLDPRSGGIRFLAPKLG